MNDIIKTRNYLAYTSLALAKISGIIGLGCAYIGMNSLGGILLGLDGLLLAVTVTLCFLNMRSFTKQGETNELLLKKMMEEGTLRHHLKQIGYR